MEFVDIILIGSIVALGTSAVIPPRSARHIALCATLVATCLATLALR